jgi:hypothetical protein
MGAVTAEQQKLVLNMFALALQNNLVTGDAVSWNEYDGEMDDRNGLQVLEQITPRYNITRTENGVKDLSAGTDGTVFGSELFEVTGTFNANMGWGDFVKIKTVGEARESEGAQRCAAVSASPRRSTPMFSKSPRKASGNLDRHASGNNFSDYIDDFMSRLHAPQGRAVSATMIFRGMHEPFDQPAGARRSGRAICYGDTDVFPDDDLSQGLLGRDQRDPRRCSPRSFRSSRLVRVHPCADVPALINGANQNVDYAACCQGSAPSTVQSPYADNCISTDAPRRRQTSRQGEVFTIAGRLCL